MEMGKLARSLPPATRGRRTGFNDFLMGETGAESARAGCFAVKSETNNGSEATAGGSIRCPGFSRKRINAVSAAAQSIPAAAANRRR